MRRSDRFLGVVFLFLALSAASSAHLAAQPMQPAGREASVEQVDDRSALASEEALARFEQVLQRKPFHNPAFSGLVKHHADQGRLKNLIQEYERRVEALPGETASRIVLARLYLRGGRSEQAAELIEPLQALPESLARDASKLLTLKAEVYQRIGRLEAAQTMLEAALSEGRTISERLRLSEALADLHLRAGSQEEAAGALQRLSDEYPDNYLHCKRIADALSQRELHKAAAAELQDLLQLVEGRVERRCEVLYALGRSHEQLNRHTEAIEVYVEAIRLLSGGHWMQRELHERVVGLYRVTGRLEELVRYCRDQVERAPEETSMRVLLADVLAASGDAAGARQVLAEATELFPEDRLLSEERVRLLDRTGDAQGVADEYRRIIIQHPEDVELYIAYGQFLANNEQLEAARNQWKHVLNSELADASLANRLGALFEAYELSDDAVDCYERAISLSPDLPDSYTSLSRLWFFRTQKDKALETLRRMAQANPDDAGVHATLCQSMLNLGLAEEALGAIQRACDLEPDRARYQLTRADLLVRAGRLDEALQVRRRTVDLIGNPLQQAQAIHTLVSMHASADRLDQLNEVEQERLNDEPDEPVTLLILARIADVERDFSAARQWLTKLIDAHPDHEAARRQLARLHEAVGDIDAAVATYQTLIEQHPSRGRQYYQEIADVKQRYNDKAGAIETFERMVQADPDNATVLKEVAEQLVRLEEPEKAITYYEQALRNQPNRHEVRLAYAEALEKAGRLEAALKEFKRAAMQQSDRDSAVEALAKMHDLAAKLGVLDDLLEELQLQVETDPDNTLVARTLAELLIREYEYSRAMNLLDLVLRHHPRDVELQLARGELLRRLTRFDESVDAYRRVLRVANVDRDFVLGELGKAHFEAGRLDEARSVWRRVTHKLYAGTLLRNNGLLEDALEVFREGIRLKPDDYGLHRSLIRTLRRAGKTDEALEAARRLLDLEPDNVFNIQQLAKAYLEQGKRDVAAEIAGRLFSAGVAEKKGAGASGPGYSMQGMPVWAMSLQSAWWGFGQGPVKSNLDRALRFFQENGLLAELEEILLQQLEAQPHNAMLRQKAASLFGESFGKPQIALRLMKELETAEFPLEYQRWLGQCSQQDYMRVQQYQLIASKPVLRDERLGVLKPKAIEQLSRDQTLELAVIRQAQGVNDRALELLQRAVETDDADMVALSALVDLLVRIERFAEAEPFAIRLCSLLSEEQDRLQAEMVERVRRDFVRTLPLQFQMRVSDELLRDIAHKWSLGQSFVSDFTGFVQTMGYFRARLTLATIYAKTDRMALARDVWNDLTPRSRADAEGWTMLAGVAQLHDQQDLSFTYYERALEAAKVLASDPLLQRVYSGSLSQIWFGQEEAIDSSFNKIVEAFAGQDKLLELYDFLRETEQISKARRVAEQYELYEPLERLYRRRFDQARGEFRESSDDALDRSVPYFAAVCKLAEIHDRVGKWPEALKIYETYLADFPDELGLLITLGEVAEIQGEYEQAVYWEKQLLAAKERLARNARGWALRQIHVTPAVPQILDSSARDQWSWAQRWGKSTWAWGYGGRGSPLERWPSWMRLSELYLALDNTIAAANAMERAIGEAKSDRSKVSQQILNLVHERQLTRQMLPVLRSLAVHLPTDERAQLTFAESLTANDRPQVATEVYRRMLRRGVSDVGVLAQVRRQLGQLEPDSADVAESTVASIEAEVAADPDNANNRLRLAKAYYYSLQMDKALETLNGLVKSAPHLEGLHDLLVETYTIRGDTEKLVEALRTKIERTADEKQRRAARQRLVEELLALGRMQEALETLKRLADPKNPSSYQRVGMLLHYFGRHDDAIEQFRLSGRSQQRGMWSGDASGAALAKAMVLKGDLDQAAEEILKSVEAQAQQMSQYGGMAGMFSLFDEASNHFQQFATLFVVEPGLRDEVERRLTERHDLKPTDPHTAKLLMQFYRCTGRSDGAEVLLEKIAGTGVTDQELVMKLVDRAVDRQDYDKAVSLAEEFISQQLKPKLPPGVPAQFAGIMTLMSPRNMMLCKLGDVYWKMEQPEKAFEAYEQIVDPQVDESRIVYASLCILRGRQEEAMTLVDEALSAQHVKSPNLLKFRAMLSAVEDQAAEMFNHLAKATEAGGGQVSPFSFDDGEDGPTMLATLAKQTKQIDRFAEFMQERLEKNPNKWEDHLLLAETLYEAGRVAEALDTLQKAAETKSLQRQVLQQRTAWLEGYAAPEELIQAYEELIALAEREVSKRPGTLQRFFGGGSNQPQKVNTQPMRNRLGDLLWNRGDHERADTVWTERLDLETAASHLSMGRRYLQKREYERAGDCFCKALELQPNQTEAHTSLAVLSWHLQDQETALGHLREVFLTRAESLLAPDPAQQSSWSPTRRRRKPARQFNKDLRAAALDIGRSPAAAAELSEPQSESSRERRIVLAAMTGDWEQLETLLPEQLEARPYDPMLWSLWANTLERKGDWRGTAEALEYLRRLRRTTIGDHRNRLKLVLAGKHVRDAAAGTREAEATVMAQSSRGGSASYSSVYQYYGSSWSRGADAGTSRLAALYVRLEEFEKAERLYLLTGDRRTPVSVLPRVAELMWLQGAKERAVELMRLAMVMSRDAALLSQYASLLTDLGRTEEAVDLLVRAYSSHHSDSRQSPFAMMYGGYARQNRGRFEDRREEAYAAALYEIVERKGRLDSLLAKLKARAADAPADGQLPKLLFSLLRRDGRWAEAAESLATLQKAHPQNRALAAQRLDVSLQLGDWSEALAVLTELRETGSESASQLCIQEAFVRLMQGDVQAALRSIEPLLEASSVVSDGVAPAQVATILAVCGEHDRLIEYLQETHQREALDQPGRLTLWRALQVEQQWKQAAQLALDEFWKQPEALHETSEWYGALVVTVNGARLNGQSIGPREIRLEDAALLNLVSEGPSTAKTEFARLVEEQPGNLNARRGLVFAAALDHDQTLAIEANEQLIEWLKPRRPEVWHPTPARSLGERAGMVLNLLKSSDVDSSTVLGMSMSFDSLLQQVIGGQQFEEPSQSVTYEALWNSHQKLQGKLLLGCGETDRFIDLARAQGAYADALAQRPDESNRGRRAYYQNPFGSGSYIYGVPDQSGRDRPFDSDWRAATQSALARHSLLEPLAARYRQLGTRVPIVDWDTLSGLEAALGRHDEAQVWRRKLVDAEYANLQATDGPQANSETSRGSRWRRYGQSTSEQTKTLRSALRVSLRHAHDPPGKPDPSPLSGRPNELWELALIDTEAEAQLLQVAGRLGPGWGQSKSLIQVISYYRAKKRPQAVIQLLDRVFSGDELLQSRRLSDYLRACFEVGETARVEQVLEAAIDHSSALADHVLLARLVLLRHQNRDTEADELEQALVARCQPEAQNPHCLDPGLVAGVPRRSPDARDWARRTGYSLQRSGLRPPPSNGYWNNELATVESLADALGVQYQPDNGDERMSLKRLRERYHGHRLFGHAARMAEAELAQGGLGRAERLGLMRERAKLLALAGDSAAARSVAEEMVDLLKEMARRLPADPWPHHQLASVFASEAWGPDYTQAIEALERARALDPGYDALGGQRARYLFELGRYEAAWEAYERILTGGDLSEASVEMLYRAGISACHADRPEAGGRFVRQALWCDPLHTLAAAARELNHD